MEKLQVSQVLACNRTLYKMLEQRTKLPISVGLKIQKIMKIFDEVEEYVFTTMDMTFGNINWENLTEEQKLFYNKIISEEIELDFQKIPSNLFENNNELLIDLEDVQHLNIILSQ